MDFMFISDRIVTPDGIVPEPFVASLAQALVRHGHDALVCLPADVEDETPIRSVDGVTIVQPGTRSRFGYAARRYWQSNRQSSCLVEAITRTPWFVANRTPRHASIALIHHLSDDREQALPPARVDWRALARHYAPVRTVTTLPSAADQLTRAGFKTVTVVPPAPTTKTTAPSPRALTPVWVVPQAVRRGDHTTDIVQAFTGYARRYPAARLWLLSDSSAPERVSEVETRARQLGLKPDQLRWLTPEHQHRYQELLSRAWGTILTDAPDEGTSLVIDSFAHGTPAIVYDLPGLGDAVEDGRTGMVIKPNLRSLAEALDRLSRLTAVRELLGVQARLYASHFSWDRTASRFLDAVGAPA